ncbi:MAG: hypothetical protein LBF79_05625, partial [Dysgonamonadaceae bacterium]|nr:hypothetical protein [Dysgonamonadaceae bacterium]
MPGKDFIPSSEDGFKLWSDNFMEKLSAIGAETLMPPETYHELVRLHDDYGKKYKLSEAPETRTPVTVKSRIKAHEIFEEELRLVIRSYIT